MFKASTYTTVLLLPLAVVSLAHCQEATASSSMDERPFTAVPYTPGLDFTAMDRSADPCEDFYQYTCGGWIKNNPIPPDQPRWDVFHKLSENNRRYLWGILDSLAKKHEGLTEDEAKIGAYFAACMDENAIEQRGASPLSPDIKKIEATSERTQLGELLAELQLKTGGSGLFFDFSSGQDFDNAGQVIAFADAGGLGLPDRDYYVNEDEKTKEIRSKYEAHIVRMLGLWGLDALTAQKEAREIIRIETSLAKASLTQVEKRDPHNLSHKYNRQQLQQLTPSFGWTGYLNTLGMAHIQMVNVSEPAFFKTFDAVWSRRPLAELKAFLRWHLINSEASLLSKSFVREHFAFYDKTLRGTPELAPRWQRCVGLVDAQLGEALGKEYVSRNFSPDLKAKILHMTHQIEQAMSEEIATLSWMSSATKKLAQAKLHAVSNKIGYPDHWRDYSNYKVNREDFVGNVQRGNQFESRRLLAKIGKPVNRDEWAMTPSTVNAYYDAQLNEINFPAGILQPPLYDARMDSASNYGDTGGTIGHELTHGFDDEGRLFDGQGNLVEWWSAADAQEFNKRTQCIVDQYAKYTVVDDIKINSRLTLGEDVADLGGMVLAWKAWQAELASASTPLALRDGLTPEQRFFIGFAQWACENDRPENQRLKALTDPHSPGRYRVNGVAINLPEFQAAFGCKAGQAMVKQQRCRIW